MTSAIAGIRSQTDGDKLMSKDSLKSRSFLSTKSRTNPSSKYEACEYIQLSRNKLIKPKTATWTISLKWSPTKQQRKLSKSPNSWKPNLLAPSMYSICINLDFSYTYNSPIPRSRSSWNEGPASNLKPSSSCSRTPRQCIVPSCFDRLRILANNCRPTIARMRISNPRNCLARFHTIFRL
jgi:hypothetical protein